MNCFSKTLLSDIPDSVLHREPFLAFSGESADPPGRIDRSMTANDLLTTTILNRSH